jgi:prolyl-tRNA editing enzyme YbaK/EbsC (Cys-tRNA(Pro) deacylase)
MRCGASNTICDAAARATAAIARARSLPRAATKPTKTKPLDAVSPAAASAASAIAGVARRGDELGAGVAQRRGAGVADVGDALAARQPLDDDARGRALVVLVHGDQRLREREVAQQGGAVARVLAGDRVAEGEHVERAQRQVGEVADRRGDDVERGRGILLAAASTSFDPSCNCFDLRRR